MNYLNSLVYIFNHKLTYSVLAEIYVQTSLVQQPPLIFHKHILSMQGTASTEPAAPEWPACARFAGLYASPGDQSVTSTSQGLKIIATVFNPV